MINDNKYSNCFQVRQNCSIFISCVCIIYCWWFSSFPMDPNNGKPSGFVYLVAEPRHNGMALDQLTVQQQQMPLHLLLKSEGISPWLLSTLSIINQSPDAFAERKEGVDYGLQRIGKTETSCYLSDITTY